MRITYPNKDEFKLADDRERAVLFIAKTLAVEINPPGSSGSTSSKKQFSELAANSRLAPPACDDNYFWAVGENRDWAVAFSKDNHSCMDISHKHHDQSVVESLARWIACRTDGLVDEQA